jgi:hypothetical protein
MKLSAPEAFSYYAKMPVDDRSILGLHTILKGKGFAIGREKLTKWCKDEKWEDRLAKRTVQLAQADGAVLVRQIEEATATTLEKVMEKSSGVVDSMCQTIIQALPTILIQSTADAAMLAKTVETLMLAQANVKKILAEASGGAAQATATDSGLRITGPVADVMAEWATYKKREKV